MVRGRLGLTTSHQVSREQDHVGSTEIVDLGKWKRVLRSSGSHPGHAGGARAGGPAEPAGAGLPGRTASAFRTCPAGAAGQAARAPGGIRRGRAAGFPQRHRATAPGRLAGRTPAARPARSPRRDHRAGRPEDGDQRAQLRSAGVHGGLRGLDLADVGQPARRPARITRGGGRDACVHGAAFRQALRTQAVRTAGGADGAPARLAPGREARACRRRADQRQPVRPGPVRLPQRAGARVEGSRPVLLPAKAAVDGRGGVVGRRAPVRGAGTRPGRCTDQGDGADRDAARGVRDGRDPACLAHAHRRAQLRPVGLHLFVHQDVSRAARQGAARTRTSVDDTAVPQGVFGPADPHLPSARGACDGRHGCADPDQRRSRSQRGRVTARARGQATRGACRLRRHVGRASGAGTAGAGHLRRTPAVQAPAPRAPRRRAGGARGPGQAAAGQHQPDRFRQQRRGLRALRRRVARRPGLRTDPLVDGRRRDRRDRARPAVAMAAWRTAAPG